MDTTATEAHCPGIEQSKGLLWVAANATLVLAASATGAVVSVN